MADYINVTSLNRLAKRVLEQCDPLNDLIVCGEISGFTRHYKSGHLYFTLKDENASIKTVMFRSQAQLLNFEPQNGMLVLVYGRATIYERDGAFQLYADYMKPFGAGAAQMAFDALYKKLEAEGYLARTSGADLRSKRVALTEKGEQFARAWIDRVLEAEAAALCAMPEAERAAFVQGLHSFCRLLEERLRESKAI